MPHIDQVTIHNIKSFRHSVIRFGKGFNCIVGPNGSGKSSICDALLFALGESSLKRLRIQSVQELINTSDSKKGKPKSGKKGAIKAYSSIHVSGVDLTVARAIREGNKVLYRLNGKRVTRQEMIEQLKHSNTYVTEANTITQDEIGKIMHMSKKEMRSLIDIPAGIKEFDEKKMSAMSELSKVEEKISNARSILSERAGFLKELKKEKEAAEKYTHLRDSIRSINYTILLSREKALSGEYEKVSAKMGQSEKKIADCSKEIREKEGRISELSEERIKTSGLLNSHSIELSRQNREIESVSREVAVLDSKIESAAHAKRNNSERLSALKADRDLTLAKIKEKAALLKESEAEALKLQGTLDRAKAASVQKSTDISEKYEKNRKEIESLRIKAAKISSEIEEKRIRLGTEEHNLSSLNDELASAKDALHQSRSLYDQPGLEKRKTAVEQIKKKVSELSANINRIDSDRLKLDSKIIEHRESIAVRGGDLERTTQLLKSNFKGVLGRVYELCSYEEKYAQAISAACGSRLNYVVVDTIDTASKSIALLKKNGLARTSFIPISDIREPKGQGKAPGNPLINVVSFDRGVSKAMSFVFANTNIVETIEEAKRAGIGNSRYVTLTGELVEQSGVVSGGQTKAYQPVGHLYSELEKLSKEKEKKIAEQQQIRDEIEKLRHELSAAERALMEAEYTAHSSIETSRQNEKRVSELEKRIEEGRATFDSLTKALEEKIAERGLLNGRSTELESENESLYSLLFKSNSQKEGKQKAEDAAAIASMLEKKKVEIASLSKEVQMLDDSKARIYGEITKLESEIKSLSAEAEKMLESRRALDSKRSLMEEKVKGFDSDSAQLYEKISSIDKKISEEGSKKGELQRLIESYTRELTESKISGSQISTRLGDIRAELSEYKEEKVTEGEIQSLEGRLDEQKKELESLGNVNMMAPQMYAEKGKEVAEAESKISTLESEKNSVLNMISEIESRKLSVFKDTFDSINANFHNLYSKIGKEGESAYLVLSDPTSPFESYLSIEVDDGRVKERMERKSGGERSLLIIMLVLSIMMRNTMSFYIFDEIDASLDKQNSKKLSLLLKQMGERSQFIVVSHNDVMISGADTVIGVTRNEEGSKALGIEMAQHAVQN